MFDRTADGRCVIRSHYVRGLTTGVFALFALILAPGLASDSAAVIAYVATMEILLAVLVVRAWRSATVVVDDQEVLVRSLLRTRRWPRSEVREFIVETRSVGMGGWRRRVLGVVFVDGTTRWLREINARPPQRSTSSWLDEAASAVNRREDG
jgi:hypothetical protein